jgi:RNA polymerase sigma factor (sigma-70 family)
MPVVSQETELLKKLQQGNHAAWDEAFTLLYPCVFHAARHPLAGLTPSEAEDVAIETLTALVSKVATTPTWENLRGLAITMAARRAISEKRKNSARKRGSGHVQSLEAIQEESEGTFEAPEQLLQRISPLELKELSLLLTEGLSSLEPLQSQLIQDFVVNGLSYRELSEKYKTPPGTIGVQLSRGLKKIRQCLEQKPSLLKEILSYLR